MEFTLSNIAGKLIKYQHKTCCLVANADGWDLQRWDDDTNHETLVFPARTGISVAILTAIKKFLGCQALVECEVQERKAA